MASYAIDVRPRARRSLRQLDPSVRKAIAQVINGLAADPRPAGVAALTGHRVIYCVDDGARVVTVAAVGHRREIYRSFDL